MAWADASQRSEAMPVVCIRRDFAVSNRSTLSTSTTAACRCRYQSLTAGGLIYDHVSIRLPGSRFSPPLVTLPFYQFKQPFVAASPFSGSLLDFFDSFSMRRLQGQGPQNATHGDRDSAPGDPLNARAGAPTGPSPAARPPHGDRTPPRPPPQHDGAAPPPPPPPAARSPPVCLTPAPRPKSQNCSAA